MAGAPGFEPGMPIPKTGALPLGYAPIILSYKRIFSVRIVLAQV